MQKDEEEEQLNWKQYKKFSDRTEKYIERKLDRNTERK